MLAGGQQEGGKRVFISSRKTYAFLGISPNPFLPLSCKKKGPHAGSPFPLSDTIFPLSDTI